jgi:hypothetical protein
LKFEFSIPDVHWLCMDGCRCFCRFICCVYHLVFLFSLVRYYVVSNFVRLLQFLLGNAVWLYFSFDCVVCARIAITYLVVKISVLSYNGAK